VRGVAIYMEGGGDGANTKAALRQGMDVFLRQLKDAVRARSWHSRLVCCGGRNQAYEAFTNARASGEMSVVVLLVDAEGPVNGSSRAHLTARDRWDLQEIGDEVVHLMIQTMEAWIVADREALAGYYGQHFRKNALPATQNLETLSKVAIADALARSTQKTRKGVYHKTRHGGDLLKRIDPQIVRRRCPACDRMFTDVRGTIDGARS
jgi:Domain of unknown function (DUF4276)